MNIIFASASKNKIREITAMLPPGWALSGLEDIGIHDEIPEPGATIRENSLLKAKYVLDFLEQQGKNGLAVFADDSGLEVEALHGAPGVYSARYAGIPKSDAANNKKLMEELLQATSRQARFVTVITLLINNEVHVFEGEVKGTIAYEPRGSNGFGYDPLFIPQGYRSTFAELSAEVKNTISHRANAVNRLLEHLKKLLS
jgi:XTP/dITP diphosphohydrolase